MSALPPAWAGNEREYRRKEGCVLLDYDGTLTRKPGRAKVKVGATDSILQLGQMRFAVEHASGPVTMHQEWVLFTSAAFVLSVL